MVKLRWSLVGILAALSFATVATSAVAAVPNRAQANLAVRVVASATNVAVGGNLTYTITVLNWGPRRAANVVVRDNLPANVTLVSAAPSQGTCVAATPVACSLGMLPRGAVARVTIVVQPTVAGRIVNTATVVANQRDRVRWNNRASVATIVGSAANLALSLAATPRPATLNQPLTYTLTVRNRSAADATNVMLTNRIPARSTLVSATPSQGTCSGTAVISCALGTLAAGGSAQVTIVVTPTAVGYLTNRAAVRADEPDPVRLNNSRMTTVRVRAA